MSAVVVEAISCPVCSELIADDDFDEHVRDEHVKRTDHVNAYGCDECGVVWDDEQDAATCCESE